MFIKIFIWGRIYPHKKWSSVCERAWSEIKFRTDDIWREFLFGLEWGRGYQKGCQRGGRRL